MFRGINQNTEPYNVSFMMSVIIQNHLTKKKQLNVARTQEKIQLMETSQMSQILKLTNKHFKAFIITMFNNIKRP